MPDIALSYQRAPRYYAELGALNDFEFGSAGDLVTAANLNASEQGTAWTWTVSRTPLGHTRVETGNTNFALPTTVGGVLVGTEGARRIKFDLDEAVADNLTPVYDVLTATPPAGDFRRCVVTGFVTYGATALGAVGIDTVAINASPYVVLQLNINGAGNEGTGGEVHIETQVDGGVTYKSTSIPIELNTTYHYELIYDGITGLMAVIMRSADQRTLVGTSGRISNDAANQNINSIYLQSYLNPEAGYVSHDKCGRAWGLSTPFPLFPLTVPAPDVTLTQESSDALVLEWDSLGLAFTIERSANAGATWVTLFDAEESIAFTRTEFPHFRYVDETVSDGQTYRYRIAAIIGGSSASASSIDVLVDNANSPAATDSFDLRDNASTLGDATSNEDWAAVTSAGPIIHRSGSQGGFHGGLPNVARYLATFSSDQRAEITCRLLIPGSFDLRGVAVRCQVGVDSGYQFYTDGQDWSLQVRSAGSATGIASGTLALTSGAKVALSAVGVGAATRLTVQTDTGGGWTNLSGATNIDPGTYFDGGTAGVASYGGTATVLGDDFKGYSL